MSFRGQLHYSGTWNDVPLRDRQTVIIRRGLPNETAKPVPATCSCVIDNRDLAYDPRNPLSSLYGDLARNMPIRVLDDDDTTVFIGELSALKPRRTVEHDPDSGRGDAWVEVEAAGIRRRLHRGDVPLQSAGRRAMLDHAPIAYWPMEDGPHADAASSAVAGVAAMRPIGTSQYEAPVSGAPLPAAGLPKWAAGVGPGGSDRLLTLVEGGRLDAAIPAAADTSWDVMWTARYETGAGGTSEPLLITSDGTAALWLLDYASSAVKCFISDPSDVLIDTLTASRNPYDGVAHVYELYAFQNGSDVVAGLWIDGANADQVTLTSETLGRIKEVTVNPIEDRGDKEPSAFGHLAFFGATLTEPASRAIAWAMAGYVGETAGARIERLCDEEDVPVTIVGTSSDTEPMGAQTVATFLALLDECAATDGGILYEGMTVADLRYRTRVDLYTQDAALTLDYTGGQIAPPLNVDLDDEDGAANDVTAARRSGAIARAIDTASVAAIGRITGRVDAEPVADARLADIAGWHLHFAGVDAPRYPQVTVDLDAAPSLAATVAAIDIGDIIAVTGLEYDTINLMVVGYTETWGKRIRHPAGNSHRHLVRYNCRPADGWNIAEVGHDSYSYVGSDGSTVAAAFAAGTDTSLSVAVAAGHQLWDDADAPFDILVSGARLTVTAISGSSSPQTFSVTQTAVNGVVKAIGAGAKVDVFHKSYIGL